MSDYIQIGEAARVLGVAVETVRRYEKRGFLQAYRNRTTNARLFKQIEVEALKQVLASPISDAATPILIEARLRAEGVPVDKLNAGKKQRAVPPGTTGSQIHAVVKAAAERKVEKR